MVEFENKGQDKNLGNIDDVLSFLERLYEQGVLKVDASLPNDSLLNAGLPQLNNRFSEQQLSEEDETSA